MTITIRCPVEEGAELRALVERRVRLARTTADEGQPAPGSTSAPEPSGSAVPGSEDAREVQDELGTLPAPPEVSPADLVQELLQVVASLAAGEPVDTSGLDRHTLVLHAPLAALQGGDEPGPVAVEDDHGRVRAMDRRSLRRLACEAGLVLAVVEDDGTPIDLGRRDRRLSVALRRALRLRDRTCRFPGCHATRHLHAHHVHHWADGGPTDLANLVLLCGHHHRFVHEHGWGVEVRGDGLHRFLPPAARPIDPRPPRAPVGVRCPDPEQRDPDVLRPSYCEMSLRRADRDTIVAVLDQELRRLAPELTSAA